MKIFNKSIIIFVFFSFIFSISVSKNLDFEGLDRLTLDDIQNLTTVDINKDNLLIDDINLIMKDLYQSDLISDVSICSRSIHSY